MELLLATIIQLTIQEDLTMKPFLGIDLTNNSENEHQNGIEFLIQETPAEVISIVQKQSTRIENMEQKSQPSSLLQFIQYGSIVFFLLTITTALKLDTPFSAKYHNAPWLYWSAAICGITGLILTISSRRKRKRFLHSSESLISQLKDSMKDVYKVLSVPDCAEEIDILSFFYTTDSNQIKIKKNTFPIYDFFSCNFKVYSDAETLYLVCLEGTYAFPLSSITAIRTIKKRVRILGGWHKEIPYNKGFYKQFHLSFDSYGCIHCNHYYIAELTHSGKSYGIYIPCYDIAIFERLTGLNAQEN